MAPTFKYSVHPLQRASCSGMLVFMPINTEYFCFQHWKYPTKELVSDNVMYFYFIRHVRRDGRFGLMFYVRNNTILSTNSSFQRSLSRLDLWPLTGRTSSERHRYNQLQWKIFEHAFSQPPQRTHTLEYNTTLTGPSYFKTITLVLNLWKKDLTTKHAGATEKRKINKGQSFLEEGTTKQKTK